MAIIDNIAPLKYVRIKQFTAAWMTGEILCLIQERNRALAKYKKGHRLPANYIYIRKQVQYKSVGQIRIHDKQSRLIQTTTKEIMANDKRYWNVDTMQIKPMKHGHLYGLKHLRLFVMVVWFNQEV